MSILKSKLYELERTKRCVNHPYDEVSVLKSLAENGQSQTPTIRSRTSLGARRYETTFCILISL